MITAKEERIKSPTSGIYTFDYSSCSDNNGIFVKLLVSILCLSVYSKMSRVLR